MRRMTQKCALGGLVLTVLLATTASAQRPQLNVLMQEKLEHSQDLLEALIRTEYEEVERLARELVRVSEVSVWSSSQDPSYLNYASDFRETAEVLIEEAHQRTSTASHLATWR